jgi:4'-phosphopantetheinyl transferase
MASLADIQGAPFILIQKRQEDIVSDVNLLDEDELVRHGRYLDNRKKLEFLAGRSFLKQELGEIHGKGPASISLSISDNGKPFYMNKGEKQVHFNLSHGGGYFVLGFSFSPIGVDLEKKRELSLQDIQPIFGDREAAQLAEIPDGERSIQILNLFTAKEAFIKATDKRYGLNEIGFSHSNGSWKLISPECKVQFEYVEHNDLVIAVSVDLE